MTVPAGHYLQPDVNLHVHFLNLDDALPLIGLSQTDAQLVITEDDHVLIEAEIGPSESEGAEIFSFEVVTPAAIKSLPAPSWLRGYLLLPVFSWVGVEEAVNKLLM